MLERFGSTRSAHISVEENVDAGVADSVLLRWYIWNKREGEEKRCCE